MLTRVQFSIRHKLFGAFGVILLLVAGLTAYGQSVISESGNLVLQLYDKPLMAVSHARAAHAKFNRARAVMERGLNSPGTAIEILQTLDAQVQDIFIDLQIVRDRTNDASVIKALGTAQNQIQEWYGEGLRLLQPPPGGVTALPLAMTVENSAAEAAASIDTVVELAAAYGFDLRSASEAAVRNSRSNMAALALATILVGILFSFIYARSISRPIRAATAIAERVAGGDFSDTIVSTRRDELGRLLRSLADMQASLRAKAEAEFAAWQAKDLAKNEEITEAKGELRRTRVFLDTVVENVPAMLFVKEAQDCRFVLLNRAGEELLGVSREAIIGKNDYDFFPQEEAEFLVARDREVLESGRLQILDDEPVHTPHNGLRRLRTKKIAIYNDQSEPQYLLGISEDITEQKLAGEQIAHMAHHDALTNLANRALFRVRLDEAFARMHKKGDRVALFCIDVDRFKNINDTLGHPAGDALLRLIAERLRSCVGEKATVARLGGDEFAILYSAVQDAEEVKIIAARIVQVLGQPYDVDGNLLAASASVGISIAPDDAERPDRLLKNADTGLYRAKTEGRNQFCLYEPSMDDGLQARHAFELGMRNAFVRGEFELYYQPFADLETNEIRGFEALLRWHHPERGLVSPAEFISLAEESGLIVPLGEWVLRQACNDAVNWPTGISLAVNLSPVQFRRVGLVATVMSALAASGLTPDRLELEITESALLQENSSTLTVLHQLRALGVRIAMDDFGTGYSSLSHLRSFPFDKIKIDQSFVKDLIENPDCMAIVSAVVGLGASFHVPTTAEGVETKEQLEHLRRANCTQIQGYYLARPMAIEEVENFLVQQGRGQTNFEKKASREGHRVKWVELEEKALGTDSSTRASKWPRGKRAKAS